MLQQFRIWFCFCLYSTIAFLYSATLAQGAINEWELNSQGVKVQTNTACPEGGDLNIEPNKNYSNKNLSGGYFLSDSSSPANNNLQNSSFARSILINACFDYSQTSFYSQRMSSFPQMPRLVDVNHSWLTGTVFNNADIRAASFNYATLHGLTEPQFQSTKSYKTDKKFWYVGSSDITGLDLSGNDLRGWDFQDQDLTKSKFDKASLISADFTGANLTNAEFKSANLTDQKNGIYANFSGATINGSTQQYKNESTDTNTFSLTLSGANFSHSDFSFELLQQTASYKSKNLTAINLSRNNLNGQDGWDFSGQDLTNASLSNASLAGTKFNDAKIAGSNLNNTTSLGFTQAQLQSTYSYTHNTDDVTLKGNLAGIKLNGNNLSGWDFHGQDLTSASFSSDTVLDTAAGIDTDQIYFRNNLSRINFMNFPFNSATLSGAIFTDSVVKGAKFNFATYHGFTLAQLQSTKSYKTDKDLSGIQLQGNDLSGWDFKGQTLTSASFNYSAMAGADLSQATLTIASFAHSNLNGAVFTNAIVNGSEFQNSSGTTFFVPGADFSKSNITQAQLQSTNSYKTKNLFGIQLRGNDLSHWDFSGQNLVYANFAGANLSGTDFTNADIRGTVDNNGTIYQTAFFFTPNFTQAQLQSTASYQKKDLSLVRFSMNNLSGWDFHDQSLLYSSFASSNVTGADFANAAVLGTDFSDSIGFTQTQLKSTSSYVNANLSGIKLQGNDLRHWDFSGQDLTSAVFDSAKLASTNISDAVIIGADFSNTVDKGFKLSQLQSTKSYKTDKNLTGIQLGQNNLTSWDFQGQNLTSASFVRSTRTVVLGATLNGANFSQANLVNSSFARSLTNGTSVSAQVTEADFSSADTRGSNGINFAGTIATNTILPDGSILGLDLSGGRTLVVRNYTVNSSGASASVPIKVSNKMNMGTNSNSQKNGILQMVLDDSTWNSTISFYDAASFGTAISPEITLGGTLKLTFKDGVDVTQLVGKSFNLFDWSGTNPDGTTFNVDRKTTTFSTVDQGSYTWNLNDLYIGGSITLEGTPSNALASADSIANGLAAGNGLTDVVSDPSPANNLMQVPEPCTFILLISGLLGLVAWKFRRDKRTASV
jgi:uncharacterized protein YjbI with pentapeptide repeats